jgi:rare lipoprotein A
VIEVKIKTIIILFYITIIISVIACSTAPRFTVRSEKETHEIIEEINIEKGKIYNVLAIQEGIASFYGEQFHGKRTANGEIFDMNKFTAAHRTLPLNTIAQVTNLKNSKKVRVKINDRGPFVSGRIIDLSRRAADELDFINEGTTRVRIEVLKIGDNKYFK